ncbi:hypothetical protein Tco_1089172 [Tanacetum coccineum]
MASSQTSTSRATKKPKITIIPPRQLFIDLTQKDAKTPSPKHKPLLSNAPNAPFKIPSTRGTSSPFSIASKLNSSPFYSTSPLINAYLSSLNSPPPRVSHPPPTHRHQPMDITLTLSPITPLDFAFNTPSPPPPPSPPIVAHPIPFNLLDAHGATCLCWSVVGGRNIKHMMGGRSNMHDGMKELEGLVRGRSKSIMEYNLREVIKYTTREDTLHLLASEHEARKGP